MSKEQMRRRPPTALTKEQVATLEQGNAARAQLLKNQEKRGTVSRSPKNPGVGRPETSKDSAKQKGVTTDGAS